MMAYDDFRADWAITSGDWRENICERLAVKEIVPSLVFLLARRNQSEGRELLVLGSFYETGTQCHPDFYKSKCHPKSSFARSPFATNQVDYLGELGFTLVQVRVLNDCGFAIRVKHYHAMVFGQSDAYYKPWPMEAVAEMVRKAAMRGILVVSELTVAHRAGG